MHVFAVCSNENILIKRKKKIILVKFYSAQAPFPPTPKKIQWDSNITWGFINILVPQGSKVATPTLANTWGYLAPLFYTSQHMHPNS